MSTDGHRRLSRPEPESTCSATSTRGVCYKTSEEDVKLVSSGVRLDVSRPMLPVCSLREGNCVNRVKKRVPHELEHNITLYFDKIRQSEKEQNTFFAVTSTLFQWKDETKLPAIELPSELSSRRRSTAVEANVVRCTTTTNHVPYLKSVNVNFCIVTSKAVKLL